jgi:hypothetical protein
MDNRGATARIAGHIRGGALETLLGHPSTSAAFAIRAEKEISTRNWRLKHMYGLMRCLRSATRGNEGLEKALNLKMDRRVKFDLKGYQE